MNDSDGLGALLFERLGDLIVVVFFSALALFFALEVNLHLMLVFVGIVTGFLLLPKTFSLQIKALAFLKMDKVIAILYPLFDIYEKKNLTKATLFAYFFGLIAWCLSFLNVTVILYSLDNDAINFSICLMVFLAGIVSGLVTVLPGNLGSYEAAVSFVLVTHCGVDLGQALGIALLLHSSQLVCAGLVSLYCFFRGEIQPEADCRFKASPNSTKKCKLNFGSAF